MAANARKSGQEVRAFRETSDPPKNNMNRTGHKGRVDLSHSEVINGLIQAGMTAKSIASVGGGIPDVIAGFRGVTVLLEVKSGNNGLTEQEEKFALNWSGSYAVVYNAEEAVLAVEKHAKECGKI